MNNRKAMLQLLGILVLISLLAVVFIRLPQNKELERQEYEKMTEEVTI